MSELDRVRVADLPTLETRPRPNLQKGKSRLEVEMVAKPDEKKLEKQFREKVRQRDEMRCRCCQRDVLLTIERCPEQGHVHHIYGRLGKLRYAAEHALLLCRVCHEKVTGAVNVKVFLFQLAADMVQVGEKSLIDAKKPVQFKESA